MMNCTYSKSIIYTSNFFSLAKYINDTFVPTEENPIENTFLRHKECSINLNQHTSNSTSEIIIDLTDTPINTADEITIDLTDSLVNLPINLPFDLQKIEYEIYGFACSCGHRLWNTPLVRQSKERYFPRRKNQLDDNIQIEKGDGGIHVSKNQMFNIKLKNINIQDEVIVVAKLVGNSNENQKMLSLSKYNSINQIDPNIIVIHPFNNNGEYTCNFQLLKHSRKASKHRWWLHIMVRINSIEIKLAKYYIILHGGGYMSSNSISTYISNSVSLLKSGIMDCPSN